MPCTRCGSCFFEWDWEQRANICKKCGQSQSQVPMAVDALELDDDADSLQDQQRPDYYETDH